MTGEEEQGVLPPDPVASEEIAVYTSVNEFQNDLNLVADSLVAENSSLVAEENEQYYGENLVAESLVAASGRNLVAEQDDQVPSYNLVAEDQRGFDLNLVAETDNDLVAESLVAEETDDDLDIIRGMLSQPSGRQTKFRRKYIEFDCAKGVHHGKYSTYENKQRKRIEGGFIGRLDKVRATGRYGEERVNEFILNHKCKYPERFYKDLDECGINRIEVEGWSGSGSISRLSSGGRSGSSEEH